MKFLITNDDGFDGPGLAALYQALKPLGDVRVVAPAVCHSAKGHAVNTHSPIRVERRSVDPFGVIEIVDSSPADCVRVGLCGPGGERPDFVVAGINTGANLGVDLFYSGTAAAARESAILGVPALAVSRYLQPGILINWQNLSGHVTAVVRTLISDEHCLESGRFWNVNFPAIDDDHHPGDITFAPQGILSHDIGFRAQPDSGNENVTIMEYTGDFRARGKSGECDVTRLFAGQITATPIDLCTTAPHPSLSKS
ncbi:MAG: 5'/3'-nucleotidase SurE [Fuerstiella sp.]|nr:5'/3'-nucleotidase SurE [Fuerstiella sp.]MCP4857453.1 5'/3'-nucleotidase SurE [Fuerstiella sp.]